MKLVVIFMLSVLFASSVRAERCLDTAIVFAIDGSGSISDSDFALQQLALAETFKEADVLAALVNAGNVGLAAVIWGDGEFPIEKVGWHLVKQGHGADAFASALLATPRTVWGNTDIGAGIWHALGLLHEICAFNLVIDVSGDGTETVSTTRRLVPKLSAARHEAERMAVTINGLAISTEVPDLADYYARNVISGPTAFVIDVTHIQDFGFAMRKKLIRELQSNSYSMLFLR